jgi:spore germination protein GerM
MNAGRSNKLPYKWIIILVVILGAAGFAIFIILSAPRKIDQVKDTILPSLPSITKTQETTKARLYFSSRISPGLAVEIREIAKFNHPVDQVREIITQLLQGPQVKELASTVPEETTLRGVYIDQAGCVFLDFGSQISRNHPGGSTAELQTIYSIVNTLMANLSSIKGVKILVDGLEKDTLAGHIDIRYPFTRPLFVNKAGANQKLYKQEEK